MKVVYNIVLVQYSVNFLYSILLYQRLVINYWGAQAEKIQFMKVYLMASYFYLIRVGHLIFNLRNWVGHGLFCKNMRVGHIKLIFIKMKNAATPPVLHDQSLRGRSTYNHLSAISLMAQLVEHCTSKSQRSGF